jgi:hypothetical protein
LRRSATKQALSGMGCKQTFHRLAQAKIKAKNKQFSTVFDQHILNKNLSLCPKHIKYPKICSISLTNFKIISIFNSSS